MKEKMEIEQLACNRCQHTWWPRPRNGQITAPKFCPQCRSPYWNKKRMHPRGPECFHRWELGRQVDGQVPATCQECGTKRMLVPRAYTPRGWVSQGLDPKKRGKDDNE